MFLCYVDESGTPEVPGNTSHYILAGLSIPVDEWKNCDQAIEAIKRKYDLVGEELHIAWMMRRYQDQAKVQDFATLTWAQRRYEVNRYRNTELLRLQRAGRRPQYQQTRKNYQKTQAYIHLSDTDRQNLVREVAAALSGWQFARLFAECVDKIHFDPVKTQDTIDEQAFEQVVSRFEQYVKITNLNSPRKNVGLLIHDNNETVAKKHTALMKKFHVTGTRWTTLECVIETPLFVNSELTGMVQIADLCSYALRRYLENSEEDLFDLVFKRADRGAAGVVVGVRHFTGQKCNCKICAAHRTVGGTTQYRNPTSLAIP